MKAEEVVARVQGLNSVKTLNRWVALIKATSNYEFDVTVDVNYTRTGGKLAGHRTDYTEYDIESLQLVADKKKELKSLDKAIEYVFGNKHKEKERSLALRLKILELSFEKQQKKLDELTALSSAYDDLKSQYQSLKSEKDDLEVLLEQVVEYLENRTFRAFKRI